MSVPNTFAQRFTLAGFPGPFAVRSSSEAVVVDRDARPFAQILPVTDAPADRMWMAETLAAALNAVCGFPVPSIEAPFDPRHLSALRDVAERHLAQARPLSDAAE